MDILIYPHLKGFRYYLNYHMTLYFLHILFLNPFLFIFFYKFADIRFGFNIVVFLYINLYSENLI